MSILIGVGQCGCSVADATLEQLSTHQLEKQEESDTFSSSTFFRQASDGAWHPRAVLIDTEPKAIEQCVRSRLKRQRSRIQNDVASPTPQLWSYDPRNSAVVLGHGGAGNNWAMGYNLMTNPGNGGTSSSNAPDYVLGAIRREAEQLDSLDSFCITSSAAGGTGSGLGAGLTEQLRDAFPHVPTLNAVVCPYLVGEVIVQNYNACLSFAHLAEVSDAVLLLENQVINGTCTELLNIKQPSFSDLNKVIGTHLTSTLLSAAATLPMSALSAAEVSRSGGGRSIVGAPLGSHAQRSAPSDKRRILTSEEIKPRDGQSRHSLGEDSPAPSPSLTLSDTIGHLCAHPGFKFLNTRLVPQVPSASLAFSNDSWSAILKRLYQAHVSDAVVESDIDWSVSPGKPRRMVIPASPPISREKDNFSLLRDTPQKRRDNNDGHASKKGYLPFHLPKGNVAIAALITLHGDDSLSVAASTQEVGRFYQPQLFPTWARPLRESVVAKALSRDILDMSGDGITSVSRQRGAGNLNNIIWPGLSDGGLAQKRSPILVRCRHFPFNGHTRAASLLANSQSMIRPIERVTARGFAMFQSRAYVHQYLRCGLEEEDFLGSFAQLEEAVSKYRGLS